MSAGDGEVACAALRKTHKSAESAAAAKGIAFSSAYLNRARPQLPAQGNRRTGRACVIKEQVVGGTKLRRTRNEKPVGGAIEVPCIGRAIAFPDERASGSAAKFKRAQIRRSAGVGKACVGAGVNEIAVADELQKRDVREAAISFARLRNELFQSSSVGADAGKVRT